jgi:putative transposase
MERYPLVDELLRPILRVAMPRAARLSAPGGTGHVVARCNHREFCFTTPEDFELLLAHVRELRRTSEVPLDAYTLMANHSHLRLQAPTLDALGRPLRWFMPQTAKAVHRIRKRRGHFWERRYRAGLVADPAPYPWSSCAASALGTPTPLITFPPSSLALSPSPQGRHRQFRTLLGPSADPRADARDPRWTTRRAVGSAAFLARSLPPRGRRRILPVPPQIQALGG